VVDILIIKVIFYKNNNDYIYIYNNIY